jgi:uncharacterized Tic20 family protein
MEKEIEITTEERVFAAVSHGSAIMMGWGVMIPLLIWITQREKSKFVKFHALQAMLFQLTQTPFMMVAFFGFSIVYIGAMVIMGFFTAQTGSVNDKVIYFASQVVFTAGMFLVMAVYPIIGLVAAALTFAKRDFRYPILGSWLDKYLSQESESELIKDVANE